VTIDEMNPEVIGTPIKDPQPYLELLSFADRITQLKRWRDKLQELTKLEDKVRVIEHLVNSGGQATRT
jgi:hypothetical protein